MGLIICGSLTATSAKRLTYLVGSVKIGFDQDFLALIQRESAGDANKSVNERRFELFGVEHGFLVDRFGPESRRRTTGGEQEPMLVTVVQGVDPIERVVPPLYGLRLLIASIALFPIPFTFPSKVAL